MFWKSANRRSFLAAVGSLPFFSAAAPSTVAAKTPVRDVIAELGVRPIINAAGTYTSLTASLMPPEVMAAIQEAGTKYVRLQELQRAVGERIAQRLDCEAALVSAGCASALSLATAACVAGSDRDKIRQIPDTHGMKDEVIIQKAHRVSYDHAVRNIGVKLIEVETRQEFERAVNHQTAMFFFLNSAANRGRIGYDEFVELGENYGIPTLIDAAADVPPVENLFRFTRMGFDLVAFSGGKGIRGPQSAGLLLGRKRLIDAALLNNSPNSDSVCRTNKVNKEEMVGMLAALELYLDRDHEADWKEWQRRCGVIADAVKPIETVETDVFIPEIANAVPHLRVNWDHERLRVSPAEVAQRLRDGEPSIEVRPGSREALDVGVWMMQEGDAEIVAERLREELA